MVDRPAAACVHTGVRGATVTLEVVEHFADTLLSMETVDAPVGVAPGSSYRVEVGHHVLTVTALAAPPARWRHRRGPLDARMAVFLAWTALAHLLVLAMLPRGEGRETSPAHGPSPDPPAAPYVVSRPKVEQPWICVPGIPSLQPGDAPASRVPAPRRRARGPAGDGLPVAGDDAGPDGCDEPRPALQPLADLGADAMRRLALDTSFDAWAPTADAPAEMNGGFGYGLAGTGGGGGTGWGTIGTGRYGGGIHIDRTRPPIVRPASALRPGGRRPCPIRGGAAATARPAPAAQPTPAAPISIARLRPVSEPDGDFGRHARRALPAVRRCHQQAIAAGRHPDGTLAVSFAVSPDGHVQGASATGIDDADLVECASAAFAAISFPRPEAGVVIARYELTLHAHR